MSTDTANPNDDDGPALTAEPAGNRLSDNNTGWLHWDNVLPPISTPDGRYGLLHRDLIWDCLGPGEDEALTPEPAQPESGVDRDDHYLLDAIPLTERDPGVVDDMDFGGIDPAYVASMGLQPSVSEAEGPPGIASAADGKRPESPVVVENAPVADDDKWWLHPDDERIGVGR